MSIIELNRYFKQVIGLTTKLISHWSIFNYSLLLAMSIIITNLNLHGYYKPVLIKTLFLCSHRFKCIIGERKLDNDSYLMYEYMYFRVYVLQAQFDSEIVSE